MPVTVLWLFLTVPWVGLHCMIVVFPDNTHFLTNNQFMDAQCIPLLLDIDLVIALLTICIQVICGIVEINLS